MGQVSLSDSFSVGMKACACAACLQPWMLRGSELGFCSSSSMPPPGLVTCSAMTGRPATLSCQRLLVRLRIRGQSGCNSI